jgi:hypothetical protein
MRTLLRAGVTALATSSFLLGGTVAAEAAPARGVSVTAGQLVLQPQRYGHTGSTRIAVHNGTDQPFSGNITITEPLPYATVGIDGAGGCLLDATPDHRTIFTCLLDDEIAAGATSVVTVRFQSPAEPRTFAQIAPQKGSVEIGGASASFAAIFRSTTGSLRSPRPYVQDSTAALTVAAGNVTLTRQPDGTFSGRVPVTVSNRGDAPHSGVGAAIALPAGLDFPNIEPVDVCMGSDRLPVPPDGSGYACSIAGGQLAQGERRSYDFLLTAPAGTTPGVLGTATTSAWLDGPAAPQTDGADIDTFTITVAG